MIGIYDPNAGKGYAIIDATSGVISGTLKLPPTEQPNRDSVLTGKLPAFSGDFREFMRQVETIAQQQGATA